MDQMLSELLLGEGGMSPDDVKDCAALVKDGSQTVDRLLVAKGWMTEPQMLRVMSNYLAFPFRQDLRDTDVRQLSGALSSVMSAPFE